MIKNSRYIFHFLFKLTPSILSLIASLFIITIFSLIYLKIVLNTPVVNMVERIEIKSLKGEVVLGFNDLGQQDGFQAADTSHLKIVHEKDNWFLFNLSASKKVDIKTTNYPSIFIRRWELSSGDCIRIGSHKIQIDHAEDGLLSWSVPETGRKGEWKSGALNASSENTFPILNHFEKSVSGFVENDSISFISRVIINFKEYFKEKRLKWHHFSKSKEERFLFSFGGQILCLDRWPIKDISPNAANVISFDGRFYLSPGRKKVSISMSRKGENEFRSFNSLSIPLKSQQLGEIREMVIGRTHYKIYSDNLSLQIIPVKGQHVWPQYMQRPLSSSNPSVKVHWNKEPYRIGKGAPFMESLFNSFGKIFILFLIIPFFLFSPIFPYPRDKVHKQEQYFLKFFGIAPAIIFCGITYLLSVSEKKPDISFFYLMWVISWSWATVSLFLKGKLTKTSSLLWPCAVFLAGFGILAHLQLAVGALNTRWIIFPLKHLVLLSLAGWVFVLTAFVSKEKIHDITYKFASKGLCIKKDRYAILLWSIIILNIVLFIAQMISGKEVGVMSIQPSELAKFMMVVLFAYITKEIREIAGYENKEMLENPIRYSLMLSLQAIGFLIISIMVWVSVSDFSPIMIIALLLFAMLWNAARPDPFPYLIRPLILSIFLIIVITFAIVIFIDPASIPDWFPERTRFMVLADPLSHPHSGAQVLQSFIRIAEGKYAGTASWFGQNGEVMNLPAVQDDFIASFVMHKFGAVTGFVLLMVQTFYLYALFITCNRLCIPDSYYGNHEKREANTLISSIIFGCAWITIAHCMISWGNVLGLLPVMGQPMTWLSAGNSHMLCVGLTTLFMGLIGGWVVEG